MATDEDLSSFYAGFSKTVSIASATTIPSRTSSINSATADANTNNNNNISNNGGINGSNSNVKLRSIYVGDTESQENDQLSAERGGGDNGGGINHSKQYSHGAPTTTTIGRRRHNNEEDEDADIKQEEEEEDLDESEPDPVTLPESTHTLFFTQPSCCSLPVLFATSIVIISILCLVMALWNALVANSTPGNPLGIPSNVGGAVRAAQYLSIFIALIMEEEIPTGLHLLRTIPSPTFKKKFPTKSYKKFVATAVLRILMGYAFLVNVFVILTQATGVLEIFYDVLALQFIQQLDDISFSLCKMDVLGKRLQRACTAKLFQTEFEKQKFRRSRRNSLVLKSIYFINFACFVAGMIFVSLRQTSGYYQCNRITVDFGEGIWEDPVVVFNGQVFTDYTLIFSYFNGVYAQDGTHQGRPLYKEQRKFDSEEYVLTGDLGSDRIPAEIKYSSDLNSWIFTHPLIKKSVDDTSSASWLLRSPETTEFDLLNVQGDWSIWLGRIDTTRVSMSCNECMSDTDCNLNGICQKDGTCKCKVDQVGNGTNYIGTRCEIKLKSGCGTIMSEETNVTYSIQRYSPDGISPPDTLFQEYNRPVYTHIKGFPNATKGDVYWLLYSGRRWFGIGFNVIDLNATEEDVIRGTMNFHGFWSRTLDTGTIYVSDETTGDSPVGVDFYLIGERGDQYGPFGALYPLQKDGQVGRGLFRCVGKITSRNITASE